MPLIDEKQRRWDLGKIDWDAYESHRPPYPEGLYDLIFQHHQQHEGSMDIALDVGAGGGVVTRRLLEAFNHVICSDAAAGYVSQAEERFSQEATAGQVNFLQRKFEEFIPATDFTEGRLADMLTAGTCIHFSDPATLTTHLSKLVRPGGTLAAFSYGTIPILLPEEPAKPHVEAIKDKMIRWIHDNLHPLDRQDTTGPATCQARYDNVEFDPALWTDVHRFYSLEHELMWPAWIPTAKSRVRADHERQTTVADDFIARVVGYDFFPAYFENFAPGIGAMDVIADDLKELERVIGDRTIQVKWPMMMVVATRK